MKCGPKLNKFKFVETHATLQSNFPISLSVKGDPPDNFKAFEIGVSSVVVVHWRWKGGKRWEPTVTSAIIIRFHLAQVEGVTDRKKLMPVVTARNKHQLRSWVKWRRRAMDTKSDEASLLLG